MIGLIILLLFLTALAITSVRKCPEKTAYVVERMGQFNKVITGGYQFLIPFLDKIVETVSLEVQNISVNQINVKTPDSVGMHLTVEIEYRVADPKQYKYGTDDPLTALEKLTRITAQNLFSTVQSNSVSWQGDVLMKLLNPAIEQWGLKIQHLNIRNMERLTSQNTN